MAIAININKVMDEGDEIMLSGTLGVSGNYVNGVGDVLNFANQIGFQSRNGRIFVADGNANPDNVSINPVQGYVLEFQLGTNLSNGVVRVFTASGAELGSGAYPAAITGDANIFFTAYFPKFAAA